MAEKHGDFALQCKHALAKKRAEMARARGESSAVQRVFDAIASEALKAFEESKREKQWT